MESRQEDNPLMGKVRNPQLNRQREPGEESGDWQSQLRALGGAPCTRGLVSSLLCK